MEGRNDKTWKLQETFHSGIIVLEKVTTVQDNISTDKTKKRVGSLNEHNTLSFDWETNTDN